MLRFMAFCLLFSVLLIAGGAVWRPFGWLGLGALALVLATPFAYIGWHVLGDPHQH